MEFIDSEFVKEGNSTYTKADAKQVYNERAGVVGFLNVRRVGIMCDARCKDVIIRNIEFLILRFFPQN
jgi:hypothetical protein